METHRSVLVRATPERVFALIADVTAYPEFFRGITRWEPLSDQLRGVGARFRVLMQVGSIEAGGTLVVTEWDEQDRVIAWESERGVSQWGRWRVEPVAAETRLALDVGFSLAGPIRWVVERVTARIVARHLEASLLAARRQIEQRPPDT